MQKLIRKLSALEDQDFNIKRNYDSGFVMLKHKQDASRCAGSYIFVIAGCMTLKWNDNTAKVSKFEYVGIPYKHSFVVEACDVSSTSDFLGIQIYANQNQIEDVIRRANMYSHLVKSFGDIVSGKIDAHIADALYRGISIHDSIDASFMAPLIKQELLFLTIKQVMMNGNRESIKQDAKIKSAISLIRDSFSSECKISHIAKTVGVERSYLHRRFKELIGMSPVCYRTALRMQEAQRLMLIERISPTRASKLVGYQSLPPFTRAYGKFFGQSPSANIKRLSAADDELNNEW